LRTVERTETGGLVLTDDASQGLTFSIMDMAAMMADLLSPSPNLLGRKDLVDLLFEGQLTPPSAAMRGLLGDPENYGFCSGKPSIPLAVSWRRSMADG
jgi:hypothetical protein